MGFPGGVSGKDRTFQCRTQKKCRFDPWVGKIPLEEGMATHSNILAWRIPWTESGLQSKGSQRVRFDWSDWTRTRCIQLNIILMGDRHIDQCHRTENSAIDPHKNTQHIFDKRAKITKGEERAFSLSGTRAIHKHKMDFASKPYILCTNKSKWIMGQILGKKA